MVAEAFLPQSWCEQVYVTGEMRVHPLQDVDEVDARIDAAQDTTLDEAVEGGCVSSTHLGDVEHQVLSSHGRSPRVTSVSSNPLPLHFHHYLLYSHTLFSPVEFYIVKGDGNGLRARC